jgi:hypothetical protein
VTFKNKWKKNIDTLFSDDVEKVDNVADMMTSTYPQAASKNGGHMEGHMNGGQNSTTTTTNGSGSLLASDCTGAVEGQLISKRIFDL